MNKSKQTKPGAGTPPDPEIQLKQTDELSLRFTIQELDQIMNALVDHNVGVVIFLKMDGRIQEAKREFIEAKKANQEPRTNGEG